MEAGEARAKWTGPGECVPSGLARLRQAEWRVLVDNGQATGDPLVEGSELSVVPSPNSRQQAWEQGPDLGYRGP